MHDKKNIDRYFQEQFKDFEAQPERQVWEAIELSLRKRKKRRKVLPFWLKITGIAATLLVGLLITQQTQNTSLKPVIKIVNQTKASEKERNLKKRFNIKPDHTDEKLQQVVTNQQPNLTNYEKETIRVTGPKVNSNQKKNKKDHFVHIQKNNPQVSSTAVKASEGLALAQQEGKSVLAKESTAEQIELSKKPIDDNAMSKNTKSIANEEVKVTKNSLEEILKNKNTTQEYNATKGKKWKITPTVATLYLNTNSSGSALDPQLAQNKKTNDNSASYGIGVHYALTKKMSLRSGVNRLAMGYNTNDVSYTAGLRSNSISNINFTNSSSIEITKNDSRISLSGFEKNLQKNNVGSLNQQMNYFEIPFEMSYAVVDKKIGVHLIAGFSTLLLNNNEVRLESNVFNETLGSATNLNSVHFSTNFGFGVHYKLIKSFQLSLEPMLKYQINTFTNNTSDFKPMVMGVYTGISYGF
jgi:hypothetical protein